MVLVLLGSSRLLVVGADSATAALLSAGLLSVAIPGVTPGSPEWVSYCGATAFICAGMLLIARVFKLGFLGDFLSASLLIGFLTGVGVQVLSGQIPDMLGVPKGTGTWLQAQAAWIKELPQTSWSTFAYAAATIIILVFKRFAPKVPGAIIAVVLLILISTVLNSSAHGVAAIEFSCFILIGAQSAATPRYFAMKHGDRLAVNRDILGLAGSNLAAGLSGTFVVNGSPTKTQILDGQKGRTQVANLTMSLIALLFTLYFTSVLTNTPKAVLAGIVFLIGVGLVDIVGLKQGIVLAIAISILEIIRRQYKPKDFVVSIDTAGEPTYVASTPGTQSLPGLIVFRYDAELLYANANAFVDDIEKLVDAAPDPVRWLVLYASSLDDIDYSAGIALSGLLDFLQAHNVTFALARADQNLLSTLHAYGLAERIAPIASSAT